MIEVVRVALAQPFADGVRNKAARRHFGICGHCLREIPFGIGARVRRVVNPRIRQRLAAPGQHFPARGKRGRADFLGELRLGEDFERRGLASGEDDAIIAGDAVELAAREIAEARLEQKGFQLQARARGREQQRFDNLVPRLIENENRVCIVAQQFGEGIHRCDERIEIPAALPQRIALVRVERGDERVHRGSAQNPRAPKI